MKKIAVLGAGAIAAAMVALVSPGVADSEPASTSALDVRGVPYGQAVAILRGQGVKTVFGGATSGNVPQGMCIVYQQTVLTRGKMRLMLDCSEKAQEDAAANAPAGSGGGRGPQVGSNGVTTVQATPVAPPPAMPVPGA